MGIKRTTKPIAVLGAGPVGLAKYYHLKKVMAYKDVRLWSPAGRKGYVSTKERGYIKVRGVLGEGQVDVDCRDALKDALDGIQQIFVTVAAMGHPEIIEGLSEVELNAHLAEMVKDYEDTASQLSNQDLSGKSITTIPDNFMSAMVKASLGNLAPQYASGTFSAPYGCRPDEDGTIFVKSLKPLDIAAFPGKVPREYKCYLRQFFPGGLNWRKSTLELAIRAPGPIIHPTALLTNMGAVENPNIRFKFYGEGMSEGVCNIIEANSREMVALGKRCGYIVPFIVDVNDDVYPKPDGTKWKNFREFAMHSYSHNATLGDPLSLIHRYFLEDVPHGLVLLEQLARIGDLDFKNLSSVITLSGTALKKNFRKTGITLKVINMEGLTIEQVIVHFEGKGNWDEEEVEEAYKDN